MLISNFSLVNQKLAFAKALCISVREIAAETTPNSTLRLRQEALLSSGAFQLSLAFHFYLREIADRNHLKNSGAISTLDELESSLTQSDKFPSELAELRELASSPGAWLEQLLLYTQMSMRSPAKGKKQKSFQQENLILAVEISASDDWQLRVLTIELLESWLNAFRSMVVRQRDTGAEF